jgi:hypothetical protein
LLDCPVHSIFPYQSKRAQVDLRDMTTFLVSEKPAEPVALAESVAVKPEAVSVQEPAPETVKKKSKKKWGFFKDE